jgi:hypothetical protein
LGNVCVYIHGAGVGHQDHRQPRRFPGPKGRSAAMTGVSLTGLVLMTEGAQTQTPTKRTTSRSSLDGCKCKHSGATSVTPASITTPSGRYFASRMSSGPRTPGQRAGQSWRGAAPSRCRSADTWAAPDRWQMALAERASRSSMWFQCCRATNRKTKSPSFGAGWTDRRKPNSHQSDALPRPGDKLFRRR